MFVSFCPCTVSGAISCNNCPKMFFMCTVFDIINCSTCPNPQLIVIHIHQLFRMQYTCCQLDTVTIYWCIGIKICRVPETYLKSPTSCESFSQGTCSPTLLYYTILYYTILYYIIIYYTILYHTIPYYTILYYTIL